MPESNKALQQLESALSAGGQAGRRRRSTGSRPSSSRGAPRFARSPCRAVRPGHRPPDDAHRVARPPRLAERLADIPNAPPDLMRRLSGRDRGGAAGARALPAPRRRGSHRGGAAGRARPHAGDLGAPRPVGACHRLAVERANRVVVNAVASNPGARFSTRDTTPSSPRPATTRCCRRRSASDGHPPRHMAALFELAKAAARQRLSGLAGERGDRTVARAVAASAGTWPPRRRPGRNPTAWRWSWSRA